MDSEERPRRNLSISSEATIAGLEIAEFVGLPLESFVEFMLFELRDQAVAAGQRRGGRAQAGPIVVSISRARRRRRAGRPTAGPAAASDSTQPKSQ
jgi:hypothetical protein